MSAKAALRIIRECIAADRLAFTKHFLERLEERALFWPDVATVFDRPTGIRAGDGDPYGRPKWIVSGPAADGLPLDVVCVLDQDPQGHVTVLITIYFQ